MNNRVAFIDFQKPLRFDYIEPEVPLGFLFLSHAVKRDGFATKLFSYWQGRDNLADFVAQVAAFEPDVIAMSGICGAFAVDMMVILEALKARLAKAISIFGGVGVTISPEAYLNEKAVDYVCLGEGDKVFLDFCRMVRNGQVPAAIPGIYGKDDFDRRPHEVQVIQDLSGLDMDMELIDWNPFVGDGVLRSLQTSRGCPFACHFCYRSAIKAKYRMFPVEKVLGWARYVKARTDCRQVRIIDDHFFVDKHRSIEVITKYREAGIGMVSLDLRMEDITGDLFATIARIGIDSLFVGLESPIDRILKGMNKRTSRAVIDKAFSVVRQFRSINVGTQMILGVPGMSDGDLKETIGYSIGC